MQHLYIDRYAGLDSFIHKIDPRIKVITFFIFILYIVLTNPFSYLSFLLYGLVILFLIAISRIPFPFIFKKTLAVIPFVVLIAVFVPFIKRGEVLASYTLGSLRIEFTREGIVLFWAIVIKSYLSILCMILLTSSIKFTSLLKSLEKLKIPKLFIMIASFMYRYSFLIIDEAQRMQRAKKSRAFKNKKGLSAVKMLSNIAGVLFVRSYERAERVYLAMCARGFQGEIKTLDTFSIVPRDIMFLVSIFATLLLIQFV
ncbi:MAG: cobalt ECF transporter T component CbiQ [Candidatus Omnitrophica bacterium]|nr:cobalt ECF transporter T component CbiQ [Candidatus Omnitrophota bacterium]